jgi:hypothetical protein
MDNNLRDKKVVGVFVHFRAPLLIDEAERYRILLKEIPSSMIITLLGLVKNSELYLKVIIKHKSIYSEK